MRIHTQEIKHPLVHLYTSDTGASTVWWEDVDGDIYYWDDLPANYPRWTIGNFDSREEAVKRLKEMTSKEGWEIVEDNLTEK